MGVPVNAVVEVQFSKRIDPFTVSSSTMYVYPQDTGIPMAASIAVSGDGLTATLTPASPLQTGTGYQVIVTSGVTDLEGQGVGFFAPSFSTGLGAATAGPAVVSVSPANGITGVPVNGRVDVLLSVPVSLGSVVSGTVTLTAAGVPVSGTFSVSSDRRTVTFIPSSLLTVSTSYVVMVSGLTDQAGNVMTPFTSGFTTGASGVGDTTGPSVVSVSPSNGATGAAVNSSIVLTFNEAVDATTVNNQTVPITVNGFGGQLAGSYAVNGTVVTFTPLTPLPGSATMNVEVSQVMDLAGNANSFFFSSFTTAAATDTTSPRVVMVTPGNGTTGVGLNAVVTLTFSKSLNPNTVSSSMFGLLSNGSKLSISTSISADNRVVTLSAGTLPAASVVTVVATSGVTDLSGNGLSNFESSFTTGTADTDHPVVVSQRPGNGATGVPLQTSVVLYLNEPMNTGTLPAAVHVSQNGVLASGVVQVSDNGQVVQFLPASPWQSGALIQVFVDATALDTDGNNLSAYQGSFTTAADTSAIAPVAVSANPAYGTNGVATNVVIDAGFNEVLSAATVNGTNVYLTQGFSTVVPSTVSLINGGTGIRIVPGAPLQANTQYFYHLTSGVLGTNGLAMSENDLYFITGNGTDTTVPTVVSVSPPNGSTNVGDNVEVHVVFSKPVDPLTVGASTIQLSGGGKTQVADAISFGNNNQDVVLVPHGPLPDNTVMTITIAGVTDGVGNAVTAHTTTFRTGSGPDLAAPAVVGENPFSSETNVPVNAMVQLQMNETVDPGTVNTNTLLVQDGTTGEEVAGSYSVSADGRTVSFVPGTALGVSRSFNVTFANRGITDLAGNTLACAGLCNYSFTTGTAANTSGPQVVGVSPANGLTAVPINAQVVIGFSEPVDAATLGQVALSGSGGNVNVTQQLMNGNQMLVLIPQIPLDTNTTYTLTVTGVQDVSGNALLAPLTTTFTTGAGADLTAPSVLTISPASGAVGVPVNAVVEVQFSKRIDPFTVSSSTMYVYPQDTGIPMAASIAVSGDGLTATLTPASPLQTGTGYQVIVTSGVTDLEGQGVGFFAPSFSTGLGAATSGPAVVSVSPANGITGVPVNGRVDVLLSAPVSLGSVVSGTVTLTAAGAPVWGTFSVSSDRRTVTFIPSSLLTVSTSYVVMVSGLTDQAGNVMTPFTSGFTTGASGVGDTTGPSVVSVSPSNGATGAAVNSSIVLTFNEAVDATTVNNQTVPITVNGFGGQLAGSYAVNGTVVTFTPLTPLPGSATMNVEVSQVMDLAGNANSFFFSSFTTAAATDTTSPRVVMVTPGNGTTGVGLNAVVTLTFSKSLNPNTVSSSMFGLLSNGSKLSISTSISADNRVVTLSAGTLPAASVVTVVATSGVTDLSGNGLSNFESSFTTGTADTDHPVVVSQRPGNGATGVPLQTSVVLYLNEPMNTGTLPAAVHVSQNGVLASGVVQVSDNGQVVQFLPASPWQSGALIQVFVDATALDIDGNNLSAYQGSFTTAADTSTIAPVAVSANPAYGTNGVATNVVIDAGFNEVLSAATVNGTNVYLTQGFSTVVPSTVSLINGGTGIRIVPGAPLQANTQYFYHLTSGVLGTNGLAMSENDLYFITGNGTDTTVPTVVSVSPPNGSTNVGDNVEVHVVFSKPVNPLRWVRARFS